MSGIYWRSERKREIVRLLGWHCTIFTDLQSERRTDLTHPTISPNFGIERIKKSQRTKT